MGRLGCGASTAPGCPRKKGQEEVQVREEAGDVVRSFGHLLLQPTQGPRQRVRRYLKCWETFRRSLTCLSRPSATTVDYSGLTYSAAEDALILAAGAVETCTRQANQVEPTGACSRGLMNIPGEVVPPRGTRGRARVLPTGKGVEQCRARSCSVTRS